MELVVEHQSVHPIVQIPVHTAIPFSAKSGWYHRGSLSVVHSVVFIVHLQNQILSLQSQWV